jgi:imidazolonepropionase-like amidohydrolase
MKKAIGTMMLAAVMLSCILAVTARLLRLLSSTARAAENRALALKGAKIYTSSDAPPISNGTVVVRNAKIVAVGDSSSTAVPRGAHLIDCTGMIVAAGFQNSHVHFTEPRWDNAGTQPAARLSTQLTGMFTMYGFTTVVDTGSLTANTNKLRVRVETGEAAGPRIIMPVTSLFPPDGLPIYLQEFRRITGWVPDAPALPEAAVAAVQRNKGEPKDILKLFTGSLVTYQKVKPMPVEVARAAVTEAHREGRLVWAHPSDIEGVRIAMNAGVDVLAHTTSAPGAWEQDLIDDVVRHKMALIPTLKLWKYVTEGAPDPSIGEAMLQNGVAQLRGFSRAGGAVVFGTDVGFMHDYDPTDEYVYMASALSPMQVLAALTTAPAEKFKEGDRRGRVAVGMDADLVVLGSDPAKDVRSFADVRYTIRQGRIIYPTKPLE